MYTSEDRERIRADVIESARRDARITGIAVTGSASQDREDGWSDIDLAFGVDERIGLEEVIASYSDLMYARHGALAHLDVPAGPWIYRVFLLASTLQVDLAFVSEAEFGARAPTFRLVHGRSRDVGHRPPPAPALLVGYAWLYALHVRSSIGRGRRWQAEYMLHEMRDRVLALACLRHGVPAVEARGVDALPRDLTDQLARALPRSLDPAELRRAFGLTIDALLAEIIAVDTALASRLETALHALAQ